VSKRAGSVRRALAGGAPGALAQAAETAALASEVRDPDHVAEIALPRDHPKWARDRFTLSATTKAWLDRIRPVAIRVFGFWDHRAHRLALEGATIEIDVSGSYRSDCPPRALDKRASATIG
jgi:hypothetical protein